MKREEYSQKTESEKAVITLRVLLKSVTDRKQRDALELAISLLQARNLKKVKQ